ncbi:MAG TPA: metallopeptidase TldD-related protein [Acidimicrobiales bacterium]|nr:metallopeptidase TldD-related protein [Acidimicrobiales bacterium]
MTSPQDLVDQALSLSGADGCVVLVEEASEANLRWANNTLTTNGSARSRSVTVVSVVGASVGSVTRQGATVGDLADLVAESEATARQSTPAEDAAPLVGAGSSSGDWSAPPAETSISVFGSFAPALGESFARAGASKQLLYGFAHHQMASVYVGSSTGLRSRYDQPTGHTEINAKSADLARSVWVGVPTADFGDVDVPALHQELDRRLGWAERRVDLSAGRYDTILPPSAVADLMIYLYWSAEAKDAHEGRTVFSRPGGGTRVGERLSDQPLTLRSDAAQPGLECAPFVTAVQSGPGRSVFDNGSRLEPTAWISNGVLGALVQTRYSAALTGLPFTPYVDNLVLESADAGGGVGGAGAAGGAAGAPGGVSDGADRLVAGVERGLLLTCLWYIREVDPQTLLLTGLTRDGVYLVEGGEVTAAVNNFRFNESPVDLLARASGFGPTERTLPREWCDYFTRTAMPAMRVPDFNMSSVSEAS